MNLLPLNADERLAHVRELYEAAREAVAEEHERMRRHMRQYRGDLEIDGSAEPAQTVRNITYEIIESQVSGDVPAPLVEPLSYTERRAALAGAIERLCASVRDRLPFEELCDLDERYTYIYGGSVTLVEWDQSASDGHGEVAVRILPPTALIPEPHTTAIEDMSYCFLRFLTTREELVRSYGIREEELSLADVEPDAVEGASEGAATVIVCFYRDEGGEVGQFIFSGELILRDLPAYYRRKRSVCRTCHAEGPSCTCTNPRHELVDEERQRLCLVTTVEDGEPVRRLLEHRDLSAAPEGLAATVREVEVPYYTPREFPIVVRKNISTEGHLFGQSDCEFIRPEQQAINKIETRILQKLLRAGVTPIVPEDATVALNNAVFGQVIKMKPGESAAQYGTVDTTPDISQDIAEAERLYLHAKRTLGISDAYQGMSATTTESGYARQLQIDQAGGRLASKRTMKYAAYARLDRLIFAHYLAYADDVRDLSYRSFDGRCVSESFRRYDFLYEEEGCFRFDDRFRFSAERGLFSEGDRRELWERNLTALRQGALGDPTDERTLLHYWQAQERAHYPFARDNVLYFLERTRGGERV